MRRAALGRALEAAFARAFALPNLMALFGEGATANRAQAFAAHFAARTRAALSSPSAPTNPYLWQVLAGRYPPGARAPWLDAAPLAAPPKFTLVHALIDDALRRAPGPAELIHLSNVLDRLDPGAARETLALAHARLVRGGAAIVRQLNSTLNVRAAGPSFAWDHALSERLHATDRSYFYRALHVGWRR